MESKKSIWYYIRNYRSNSLFIRNLIVTFLLIILPLSMICVIVYNSTTRIIQDGIGDMNTGSVYRIKDVMDTIFSEAGLLAANISLKPETEAFMLSKQYIFNYVPDKLTSEINTFTVIYKYIRSIYVYSESNGYIISNVYNGLLNNFSDKNWIDEYKKISDDSIRIHARISDSGYPYFISIIKPFYFFGNEKIGAVVINIDLDQLDKVIGNAGNAISQNTFLLDKSGVVLYSHDKSLLLTSSEDSNLLKGIINEPEGFSSTKKQNGTQYIVSSVESEYGKWKYAAAFPISYYDNRLNGVKSFMVYFTVFTAFAGVILCFLISVRTFQPVRKILSVLDNSGVWNVNSLSQRQKSPNELDYIRRTILQTVQANRLMEEELKKRMLLLNNAQAAALQAQINPHFLCNTLDTIKWGAIELTGGKNEISSMVTDLSHLFSLGLDMENRLVPISTEIEHAKLYVKIMEFRFTNMFQVIWEIEPSILNCKIVKLSFQPLIENAIYHGIKPKKSPGAITVKSLSNDKQLCIQFIDNGVGMTLEEMEELNKKMNDESAMLGEHIGMRNVNQRIKLLFGNHYGITTSGKKDCGTTVEIYIPRID